MTDPVTKATTVVIIGAGPAGTACAASLHKQGIRVILVDENRRSGGQIFRRQPANFGRSYKQLYGSECKVAERTHLDFDALSDQIDYRPLTSVWAIEGNRLFLCSAEGQEQLDFDALVICSGASDRLMAIKGWEHAGVFSIGGAQIALKSQACAIGQKTLLVGTGPLLYLVAYQYLKSGAKLAGVLDTSPFLKRIIALPALLQRPKLVWQGLIQLLAIRLSGAPLKFAVKPIEILGNGEGVSGVRFAGSGKRVEQLECDAVALGFHLRPESQLADLAGCEFRFDRLTRQWLPDIDDEGRSSVPSIYLAGDGGSILGADAARLSGQLVAQSVATDLGHDADLEVVDSLKKQLQRMRRFARGLSIAFPWPSHYASELTDDTVVCRCEGITAGELREVVTGSDGHETEANRAKSFSRVGMGRCQGRYCAHTGAEVLAAYTGLDIDLIGRLRGQAPVKPIAVNHWRPK